MQDELPTPERDAGVAISELTAALACIPERQRQALLLREFQGLSYEEIAAELGVTVAAVETLLFRARRSVAGQLEQTGMRASALTSVLGFLRWLLPGGAKVAAVAATATLVVTPGMHGPAKSVPAPAKIVPPTPAVVADPDRPVAVQTPRIVERKAPVVQSRGAKILAPAADAAEAPTASTASDAPKVTPVSAPSVQQAPPAEALAVTTPELTVSVPVESLPEVQVPSVELPPLPVELPQLPPLEVPELQLP